MGVRLEFVVQSHKYHPYQYHPHHHQHFTHHAVVNAQVIAYQLLIASTQLESQVTSIGVELIELIALQFHSCHRLLYHQHFTHHVVVNAQEWNLHTLTFFIQLNQLTSTAVYDTVPVNQFQSCPQALFHQHFTHQADVTAHQCCSHILIHVEVVTKFVATNVTLNQGDCQLVKVATVQVDVDETTSQKILRVVTIHRLLQY